VPQILAAKHRARRSCQRSVVFKGASLCKRRVGRCR
jgi:hypothetical protein